MPGAKPTCECGACSKCLHRERTRRYRAKRGYVKDPQATERSRRWREKNRELDRQRERERYLSEDEDARKRRNARNSINSAVRRGALERQSCEVCGEYAQAHHDDYDKPLDVRWLCSMHHAEHHMQERSAA